MGRSFSTKNPSQDSRMAETEAQARVRLAKDLFFNLFYGVIQGPWDLMMNMPSGEDSFETEW